MRVTAIGATHHALSAAAAALLIAATGCQLTAKPVRLLANQPEAEIAQAEVDTAKLHTEDEDIYQPSFRILDLPRGRERLIVQDPQTHHYRVVGGW
jgi:hypothetical protein